MPTEADQTKPRRRMPTRLRVRLNKFVRRYKTQFVFCLTAAAGIIGGMIIASALLGIKYMLSSRPFFRYQEQSLYGLEERYLFKESSQDEPLGTIIIDVSRLFPKSRPALYKLENVVEKPPLESVTPRGDLQALVEAIAKCGPASIGIDIDLRSTSIEYRYQAEDVKLLDQCLRISDGTATDDLGRRIVNHPCKVVVGVHTDGSYPDERMSSEDERYKSLWATVSGPKYSANSKEESDPWWLPIQLMKGERERMPGFAAALVPSGDNKLQQNPPWGCMHDTRITPKEQQLEIENPKSMSDVWSFTVFWVDYEKYFRFHDTSIPATLPSTIEDARELIRNKIVLVGDVADPGKDICVLPGITDQAPGIITHACGIETLREGPVSRPRLESWWADILASGLVILGVQVVRAIYLWKTGKDIVDGHAAHGVLTKLATIIILLTTGILACEYRVVWPDALVVIASLWLHNPFERWIYRYAQKQATILKGNYHSN